MATAVQTTAYSQPFCFAMDPTEPSLRSVEYVPNPHFCFPAAEPTVDSSLAFSTPRRTTSLQSSQSPSSSRRRGPHHKSVSTLPTFTFNSSDTSGRLSDGTMDESAGQLLSTPRATGHRRGASEFVGGDARRGLADLASQSPTKMPDAHLSVGDSAAASPAKKRGHAHRRSAAISGHDLPSILQSRDGAVQPDLSRATVVQTALPAPAPLPAFDFTSAMEASRPVDDDCPQQTATFSETVEYPTENRPRVGFSDDIEFIPRPLSPLSSGSESSNTSPSPAGHSVKDSISSVLDMGSPSPSPVARGSWTLPSPYLQEADAVSRNRSSLDLSRGSGKEGHWLGQDDDQPAFVSGTPSQNSLVPKQNKPKFVSAKPNFDRRRSEPSLVVMGPNHQPNKSSISLQEPVMTRFEEHLEKPSYYVVPTRKSSMVKVKKWASGVMHLKERTLSRPKSADFAPRRSERSPLSPDLVPSVTVSPSEDPDLEELFSSHDPFSQPENQSDQIPLPRLDFGAIDGFQPTYDESADPGASIDLDAALGPHSPRSARLHGFGARRQLHSSRSNGRDVSGLQGQFHRRTESAPVLARFDFPMSGSPVQSPMADVFEEDEDEDEENETAREALWQSRLPPAHADADDDYSVGIQIMDEVPNTQTPSPTRSVDEGLGIQESIGLVGMPYTLSSSPHSGFLADRRPSVIGDTIFEEPSMVEIVGDEEEPRASTMTKSSDSSGTPTILGDHSGAILTIPPPGPGQALLMTPTTYAASTFSTPDFGRRQGSFETSRLGTSASSMTDCRTMSSFAPDHIHGQRTSVDDVPSLSSSRSTMISSMHNGVTCRRDTSDRSTSVASTQPTMEQSERRRKRSSIQSLSKLVGASFGESKSKLQTDARPQAAAVAPDRDDTRRKKENRLSRLMFWRHKESPSRGTSSSSK